MKGLCGHFSPDLGFRDVFKSAAGTVYEGHPHNNWGGPFGGAYQRDFVESWRLSPWWHPEALFSEAECPPGPASPTPVPSLPPRPFAGCPELEGPAKARCPKGRFRKNCLTDVGVSCRLQPWVDESIESSDDFDEVGDGGVIEIPEVPGCEGGWAGMHWKGGGVWHKALVVGSVSMWRRLLASRL